MSETIAVDLGERSYDIRIGELLLNKCGPDIKTVLGQKNRVIVVTDENVAKFHLHRFINVLEDVDITYRCVIIKPGEQSKSLEHFSYMMEQILEMAPDRNTTLIALGGGVVGDLTGFAASVLLRGIDFIQIPTSLLAQVDSSVGGKTGVNSQYGKNLIGSFYQPKLVVADVATLRSLPERERKSGYAEVVKYALINDPEFFSWLESNGQAVLEVAAEATIKAVTHCCKAKATIVAQDETEKGARALLNLGHTFGHALEAETGYGDTLLHGEAVAIGMVMAFQASVKMGLCQQSELDRIIAHFETVGLPTSPLSIRKDWDVDALMAHFKHDKKTENGQLTFILAKAIGQAFIQANVDKEAIRDVLTACCKP